MNPSRPCFSILAWLLAASLVLCPQLCPATGAAASEPWDHAAFTADPAAVVEAAAALPTEEGVDVLVLLEEVTWSFDSAGRAVYKHRLVYRIVTPVAVQGWSTTEMVWSPWYQERPALRARVISPDGIEHWLDPKTIGESPVGEDQPAVLSDRMVLRAPLPAVAVGAVVEEESVVRDLSPFFEHGTVHYVPFGRPVPVRRARLVVEAPASVPLRYVTRLLPAVEPQRTESDGRVRLSLEAGALDAIKFESIEMLTPGDVAVWPMVGFSTGESWNQVAKYYGELVDAQLDGTELQSTVEQAAQGASTRQEKVARLLAWLQAEVRYTGIEFGEAAIVPRPPAETLKRKYGDCKDKTALLVALLRTAGIPAHVALLSTGPGPDIGPELPGLGLFDHAIVYAPGTPDLWIDPTDPFARAGELPIVDQGRLALIAAHETTGLTLTPEAAPGENRTVATREIFLAAELGGGRVIETSQAWGSIGRGYRHFCDQSNLVDLKEILENHVRTAYGAEELTRWEHSETKDLSVPFQIRVEAKGAATAFTELTEAAVAIHPGPLLEHLPSFLLDGEDDVAENPAGSDSSGITDRPRQSDLVLMEPYVAEWRYRIVPPPGYRPATLPEAEMRQLGPATLSREVAAEDDGIVALTLRFSTEKRRLVPDEVEALRESARELLEAEPFLVSFEQVGEMHLAAGQIREALAEFHRLAALDPDRALPRMRIARTLLAAGLGEAARREARAAVELEPDLDLAYQNLGLVLTHDLIGRHLERGFALEAAVAAYRKAKELDPDNAATRQNLAILLEHDREGFRYSPQADMDEAIAEYRSLKEELDENALDENLLIALARSRRFEECKQLARGLDSSPNRNAMLLVAIAATEGPAPAIKEAFRIADPDQQRVALLTSGWVSVQLRLYPQAAGLLTAGAKGAPNAAAILSQADTTRKTRRYEELTLSDSDPRSVVKRLLIAALVGDDDELRALYSRRAAESPQITAEVADFHQMSRTLRSGLRATGNPIEAILDVMLAGIKFSIDGDDAVGYRLRARVSFGTGSQQDRFYVVHEDGGYRVLTTESLPRIGAEALRRLDDGDLVAARQWLDWARDETRLPSGDDPFAGPTFPRFWTRGSDGGSDEIRYAAASLITGSDEAEAAIPILQQGRDRALSDAQRRNFDIALARAFYWLDRYTDVLAVARRWLTERPDSSAAFFYLRKALAGLEQWEEYRQAAEERLDLLPDDPAAIRALTRVAGVEGDLEREDQLYRRLEALGKARANDFNNLAWNAFVEGRVTEQTIEDAQQAADLTQHRDANKLHTLASVYAEIGKATEAREVILQAMAVGGYDEPKPHDWYVFGRIAEHYGVVAAAAEAYRKVEPPEREEDLVTSTYRVAQRHLEALAASLQNESSAERDLW